MEQGITDVCSSQEWLGSVVVFFMSQFGSLPSEIHCLLLALKIGVDTIRMFRKNPRSWKYGRNYNEFQPLEAPLPRLTTRRELFFLSHDAHKAVRIQILIT